MRCVIVLSMKKVAIYARVSTTHQNTELQVNELSEYVRLRGWTIAGTYQDISTGTNTSRDGFRSLIKDARLRHFDIILIWKLDRLFRSLKDLVTTVNEFEELGIALVSLKDHIDLTTSTGRLMVHLIGAFAQFEADLIKTRVKSGIEKARREGKKLGRPRLHKENEIIALRKKGYSYQKIQIKLGVSKGAVWRALKKKKESQ